MPARSIGRAYRRVLALRGADVLAYGDVEGHSALRSVLASMLANTRGLSVGGRRCARDARQPDGAHAGGPGPAPPWRCRRGRTDRLSARVGSVSGRGSDRRPRRDRSRRHRHRCLEEACEPDALRAVYVTPHHQYPTTVTLKAARRLALLALARAKRIAIIEDDYDHEFHYDGRPVLPLASADHGGLVVYIGTLSKVLAPGLRIGYIVAPPPLLRSVAAIRSLLDIQGDLATEAAIATLDRGWRVTAARRAGPAGVRKPSRDSGEQPAADVRRRRRVQARRRRDGVVGASTHVRRLRRVGAPQRPARRVVVHRPTLRVRWQAHSHLRDSALPG